MASFSLQSSPILNNSSYQLFPLIIIDDAPEKKEQSTFPDTPLTKKKIEEEDIMISGRIGYPIHVSDGRSFSERNVIWVNPTLFLGKSPLEKRKREADLFVSENLSPTPPLSPTSSSLGSTSPSQQTSDVEKEREESLISRSESRRLSFRRLLGSQLSQLEGPFNISNRRKEKEQLSPPRLKSPLRRVITSAPPSFSFDGKPYPSFVKVESRIYRLAIDPTFNEGYIGMNTLQWRATGNKRRARVTFLSLKNLSPRKFTSLTFSVSPHKMTFAGENECLGVDVCDLRERCMKCFASSPLALNQSFLLKYNRGTLSLKLIAATFVESEKKKEEERFGKMGNIRKMAVTYFDRDAQISFIVGSGIIKKRIELIEKVSNRLIGYQLSLRCLNSVSACRAQEKRSNEKEGEGRTASSFSLGHRLLPLKLTRQALQKALSHEFSMGRFSLDSRRRFLIKGWTFEGRVRDIFVQGEEGPFSLKSTRRESELVRYVLGREHPPPSIEIIGRSHDLLIADREQKVGRESTLHFTIAKVLLLNSSRAVSQKVLVDMEELQDALYALPREQFRFIVGGKNFLELSNQKVYIELKSIDTPEEIDPKRSLIIPSRETALSFTIDSHEVELIENSDLFPLLGITIEATFTAREESEEESSPFLIDIERMREEIRKTFVEYEGFYKGMKTGFLIDDGMIIFEVVEVLYRETIPEGSYTRLGALPADEAIYVRPKDGSNLMIVQEREEFDPSTIEKQLYEKGVVALSNQQLKVIQELAMANFLESDSDSSVGLASYPTPFSKGLLFYGENGTGKTSLVYALAGLLDYFVIEVNNATLKTRYRGDANVVIDQFFKRSEAAWGLYERGLLKRAPHFIFLIDEVGSIATEREEGPSMTSCMLSALFSRIDRLENSGNFVVIAITNQLRSVDRELLRSDRILPLEFQLPRSKERKKIFEFYLSKIQNLQFLQERIDNGVVKRLVEESRGFTGADIANVVKKATCFAKLRACGVVSRVREKIKEREKGKRQEKIQEKSKEKLAEQTVRAEQVTVEDLFEALRVVREEKNRRERIGGDDWHMYL